LLKRHDFVLLIYPPPHDLRGTKSQLGGIQGLIHEATVHHVKVTVTLKEKTHQHHSDTIRIHQPTAFLLFVQ